MSKRQTTSASLGWVLEPSVLRQTTSQRFVTTQSRFPSTSGEQQMPWLGIVDDPSEFLAGELPLEPAVALPETEQAAEIDLGRVLLEPAGAVVGGAEDPAVGHHRRAVAGRAEPGNPADVLGRVGRPAARLLVELSDVPFDGDVLAVRRIVSRRRAAPLRPVGGGSEHDDRRQQRMRCGSWQRQSAVDSG